MLHDFNDIETDGATPLDGLIQDAAGNLYGSTNHGGQNNYGTVFMLTAGGTETLLHSFLGPLTDGSYPGGGGGKLLRDATGNLYGTTLQGGAFNSGTVFRLTSSGSESVLFNFNLAAPNRGGQPFDGLVADPKGNLYGTASSGGPFGNGTLYKLNPAGQELVLHAFGEAPDDGLDPVGGLIRDPAGSLYGTTIYGGTYGCGTVFKMAP